MMRLYLDTEFTQLNRFTYRLIALRWFPRTVRSSMSSLKIIGQKMSAQTSPSPSFCPSSICLNMVGAQNKPGWTCSRFST